MTDYSDPMASCGMCNPTRNHGPAPNMQCGECGEYIHSSVERKHKIDAHDADLPTCNCNNCFAEPLDNGHCSKCITNRER